MFKSLLIAAALLSVGWIGGWARYWLGGDYDRDIPILVHLVYFAVLAVPKSSPRNRKLPFLIMGALSALIFLQPWLGVTCIGGLLLIVGCSDWWDWHVTPRPGFSVYHHPVYGECLEENVSPRELDRRKKKAHAK